MNCNRKNKYEFERKQECKATSRYKRFFLMIAFTCMLSFVMTGCSNAKGDHTGEIKNTADTNQLSIVTTIFPPYDFARELTQGEAELKMLLKPGTEMHSYEPTPQDMIAIQNCDVFIYVGGESDAWVDECLESIEGERKVIKLLDCVEPVEEELVEGMEAEEAEETEESEAEEKEFDEHVWTSPKNAILIVSKMARVFSEAEPQKADTYQERSKAYCEKLSELDQAFTDVTENAKHHALIFGDRFPLRYFADAYNLDYYAAFPGCSSDTEASASTIAFLIKKVKEEQIPVVFKIELSNGQTAECIAEDTGSEVKTFYTCHNLTKEEFEANKTYLDFMRENLQSLKQALN
ncbi:MAG: zinc ABC transporter substrate-binding protein [Clostridia bacterium]|nr:zinc ABC transporter substrate-binding protein [Clostridia bacterium]